MTSGDVETLKGGIAQLLSGVESAFVTSLVGIFCALVYSFIHHALMKSFQSKVNALAEKLDETFPRYSVENWLADIKGESQNQTAELKSIGGQTATGNSWLEKSYAESQEQTTTLQNMDTSLSDRKVILQNIGEQVAEAIFAGLDEQLREYVDKICAAFDFRK